LFSVATCFFFGEAVYRWFAGIFTMAACSECCGDVAAFLGDLQLCLALVLVGRGAVVMGVVMRGGGEVW